jgi:hypothetical protein
MQARRDAAKKVRLNPICQTHIFFIFKHERIHLRAAAACATQSRTT